MTSHSLSLTGAPLGDEEEQACLSELLEAHLKSRRRKGAELFLGHPGGAVGASVLFANSKNFNGSASESEAFLLVHV